jgi:hypothetical protein
LFFLISFECGAIPASEPCARFIGALQKLRKGFFRPGGEPYVVIVKQELFHLLMIESLFRANLLLR